MDRKRLATIGLALFGTGGVLAGVALVRVTGPQRASLNAPLAMMLFGVLIVAGAWVRLLVNL